LPLQDHSVSLMAEEKGQREGHTDVLANEEGMLHHEKLLGDRRKGVDRSTQTLDRVAIHAVDDLVIVPEVEEERLREHECKLQNNVARISVLCGCSILADHNHHSYRYYGEFD